MRTLILVALFFTAIVNAQIINFPNSALKAQLLEAGNYNIAQNASGNWTAIDTNEDNEIDVAEAQAIRLLIINGTSITNLQGLENFSQLRTLSLTNTGITSYNMSFPNILWLELAQNQSLVSVNVSSLTTMTTFTCRKNPLVNSLTLPGGNMLVSVDLSECALTSVNVSNRTNLQYLSVDRNPITSINVSGCSGLIGITCTENLYTSLNLSGLTNLTSFTIGLNWNMTSLDVSGCTALTILPDFFYFSNGESIQSVNFSGCTGLTEFYMHAPALQSVNLSNCTGLTEIDVFGLTALNVTNCTALQTLVCPQGELTTLDLSTCPNLKTLNTSENPLVSINLTGCNLLEEIDLTDTSIPSFVLTNRPNLIRLKMLLNPLTTTLNVSGCNALYDLQIPETIQHINVSNTALNHFFITSPILQTLNLQGCNALEEFIINYNNATGQPIASVDFTNLPSLTSVIINNSGLTSLDFTGCPNLDTLRCENTPVASINLSGNNNLSYLRLTEIPIQTLDLSNMLNLTEVRIQGCPNLEAIFAKNGINDNMFFEYDNPSLVYVCQDESFIEQTQNLLDQYLGHNAMSNSYCSFTPGGAYNTITGTIRFDLDNNGCDTADIVKPNIRININDNTNQGATFTSTSGIYNFYTGSGNFTVNAVTENSGWFTITPNSANIPFVDSNNNTATQNFCIAANGSHQDLEVVVEPIAVARPGFDASYRVVYRNKGNTAVSGSVNFTFDDSKMDYVSSTAPPDGNTAGSLTWNYSNLLPFESRNFIIVLNINSPVETPAVNIDDFLVFGATINSIVTDEFPSDNTFNYTQTVVGSYDPNNIICIEGENLATTEIGKYLHYAVNFENIGNYEAENVVIRNVIDTAKYDINSLQLLNTSNSCYTRINGNIIEFIFEGINLAAASGNPPVGGHGDVLFKIKTKDNLVANDMVLQRSGIYFDYNFPVITNNAETTFAELNNPIFEHDNSVNVYPNPTKSIININCSTAIKSIELYDIQGRLLEIHLENSDNAAFDISSKQNGVYFLKITSENGSKVEKVVKE